MMSPKLSLSLPLDTSLSNKAEKVTPIHVAKVIIAQIEKIQ